MVFEKYIPTRPYVRPISVKKFYNVLKEKGFEIYHIDPRDSTLNIVEYAGEVKTSPFKRVQTLVEKSGLVKELNVWEGDRERIFIQGK